MANQTLTDPVREILARATIKYNVVSLPPGLERGLYEEVNACLAALGGRWVRSAGGHEFHTDPTEKIKLMLESGVARDERKHFQAFYTPADLAAEVVMLAGVSGKTVLEPSAGQGALVRECLAAGAAFIQCVELNPRKPRPPA